MSPDERTEFCRIAGVTSAAVSQLLRDGVLPPDAGLHGSLQAYIAKLRDRSAEREVRVRLARTAAAAAHRRNKQAMRQLWSLAEARQVTSLLTTEAIRSGQAALSIYFREERELAETDEQARARAYAVHSGVARTVTMWRDGIQALLRECESGYLVNDSRLEKRLEELMAEATGHDQPTDPVPATARRGRKSKATTP